MKICSNCGNKLAETDKKCNICKTSAKSAIPIEDENDKEKIDEIVASVRAKGNNQTKKKSKVLPIIVTIVIIGVIIAALGGGDDDTKQTNAPKTQNQEKQEEQKTPIVVTADQMIAALKENALNASNTYKGAYVEVTGRLSNIDSSGDYFSISELNNEYSFDSIMCYIKEEHFETVSKFTIGQEVTVLGTVKSVGEVMGYSINVEQIK
nr:MAG TPA: hypothetical protein [Caudoviricetes sp.]